LRAIGCHPPRMPPRELGKDSTVAELTSYAIAGSLLRLLEHLPLLRTTEEPEAVHQARVAARRLRSDLSTLEEALKRKPQKRLRSGLRDLGGRLGSLRDADVMAEQLRRSVSKLSEEEQREADVYLERIDREREVQRARVLEYIHSSSSAAEIDRLAAAVDKPPVVKVHASARTVLPPLIARRWKRLKGRVDRLGPQPSDRKLHRVRIEAKRCRYAAELAAPVLGKNASRLANALADVQTALGDLQDTVVLENWLRGAQRGLPARPAGVATALIEQERRMAATARLEWKGVWQVINDRGLADWIR
ncbi:MAG TPA: CHAD domain-containing protein, partial [Acidimicrobiales bacterium]|nr:CHAD domain-containing protein [Acidimicrobiales bacterium]